jgi:hypothetical protein
LTTLELIAGAVLAAVAVAFVARPFLRSGGDERLGELDEAGRRRLEAAEQRDRALAGLKELELDHRTGKVSDEDYRSLVGPLRRRAAEAFRALDRAPSGNTTTPPPAAEQASPGSAGDEQTFEADGGHALDAGRPSR